MTTPVAKPKPLPPPIEPPPIPAKVVTFVCRKGVWDVEIKLNDPSMPFTQRDFNQLEILLKRRRSSMRVQSFQQYRQQQSQAALANPVKS